MSALTCVAIKAYTTRVGEGPHPTELFCNAGEYMQEKGREFGTTTGRPRRCGWLDLVVVNHAIRLSGVDAIALTKIDVLSGLHPLKVCVGYEYGGKVLTHFPASLEVLQKSIPVFEELEGWADTPIDSIKGRGREMLDELPEAMKRYVQFIEEKCETPIEILSYGPGRDETLILGD